MSNLCIYMCLSVESNESPSTTGPMTTNDCTRGVIRQGRIEFEFGKAYIELVVRDVWHRDYVCCRVTLVFNFGENGGWDAEATLSKSQASTKCTTVQTATSYKAPLVFP
jgi:hypothetical protein